MKKLLFFLPLLFLLPSTAHAAIAFDNKGVSTAGSDTGKTLSFTVSASNPLLLVTQFTTGQNDTTGVTYNGQAMTLVTGSRQFCANTGEVTLWYILGQSGTHNIVSSNAVDFNTFVATSYSGVLQTGFPDASQNQNACSPQASITGTVTAGTNAWTFMAVGSAGSAPTAGTATTLRQVGTNVAITAFDSNGAVSGSTNLVANVSPNTQLSSTIVSFLPAAATASTFSLWQFFGF